jgi:leucyl/phenylalanyl-tRNA---protein transferase
MSDIVWLDETLSLFPDVSTALTEPDGLLAVGGDLSISRLVEAYRNGVFPWYEEDQPILWWSPNPRCVLYPDQLHISRSLKKALRKSDYRITFDQAFMSVMQCCAESRHDQDGTWITSDMLGAFEQLHASGIAHSVEVWHTDSEDKQQLVGGLYGIAMGSVFFGESMFSRRTDASKIALHSLSQQLLAWGFNLIDCQVHSDHLESLGANTIERTTFISHLDQHIDDPRQSFWNRKL